MNQHHLASVLFAVLGLFIAISHLPDVMGQIALLAQIQSDPERFGDPGLQQSFAFVGLAAFVLALLLGASLVLWRDRIADRLFPSDTPPTTGGEVQAVALSVLGCYVAIEGLTRLASPGRFHWDAAIQLTLGVGLFFGARAVSHLWLRGRSIGTSRDAGDTTA